MIQSRIPAIHSISSPRCFMYHVKNFFDWTIKLICNVVLISGIQQIESVMHECMQSRFSHVWVFAIPWTGALQDPPWDSLGRNSGVGCHALLQGIFPTQGLNPSLLQLLTCRQAPYHWATGEAQISYAHISFLRFFSHIGRYIVLSRVHCSPHLPHISIPSLPWILLQSFQ